MFVHPAQIMEIARRHPEVERVRLVVARAREQDTMLLQFESSINSPGFSGDIADTLQQLTKLRGHVEWVPSGSLSNDGKLIVDERPLG